MNIESTSNPMQVDSDIPSGSAHSSLSNTFKPYTDDEHRRMDEAVTHNLGRYQDDEFLFGHPFFQAYALREVIRQDNRLDREKLDDHISNQLIKTYPSLASKLVDALKTGSYRDIRALGVHINHE